MFDFDKTSHLSLPAHGGRLQQAIAEGDLPAKDWIDLSTGINPDPWPIPEIPKETFHRLPEAFDELENAAKGYYFKNIKTEPTHTPLAIPGSQWFIQHFPNLIKEIARKPKMKVLLPFYGFAEHEYWWQHHQHAISHFHDHEIQQLLTGALAADVIVIINPNNPTTKLTTADDIIQSATINSNILFIVDEAFIDCSPEDSLLSQSLPNNIIVLRSLGKFFGLAGLRVGFVFAHQKLIQWLRKSLGAWPIATPSQWIATQALRDAQWQYKTQRFLKQRSEELSRLIDSALSSKNIRYKACDYFITLECQSSEKAFELHQRFKANAVLIRHFESTPLVRLGLPRKDELRRLEIVFQDAFQND